MRVSPVKKRPNVIDRLVHRRRRSEVIPIHYNAIEGDNPIKMLTGFLTETMFDAFTADQF